MATNYGLLDAQSTVTVNLNIEGSYQKLVTLERTKTWTNTTTTWFNKVSAPNLHSDTPVCQTEEMWRTTLLFAIVTTSFLVFPRSINALEIPSQEDWTTKSVSITEGADGEWDRYLWGAFANSLIKKDDTYYHYYQGSITYDNTCDSVAQRSIGVATSPDGINWTKHPNNPIITWSEFGSIEEGAVSSGAWLHSDGQIYMYYGANSGSGCTITSNGRLAVSSDGINFTDSGQVMSGSDPRMWASGDELFPIGAYKNSNKWYIFYTPNGVPQSRKLGIAWGNSPTNINSSSAVNSGTVSAWGPVSVVFDGQNSYFFTNESNVGNPISIYSFTPSSPSSATLERTYVFDDCAKASVLYEPDYRWLMLCRSMPGSSSYLVKTVDLLPPTPTSSPTPTAQPTITGDINNDGVVNILDYTLLSNAFGSSDPDSDLNDDGIVNILDYTILSNNFGSTS